MKKSVKWLWLVMAILMVVAGVLCWMNPMDTIASLAWVIGLVMLFAGVFDIVCFAELRVLPGSGWMLVDGIVTVLLAVFVLMNNMFTASAVPYMFSMWLIFGGIERIVNSFDLKRFGLSWGWQLAAGILMGAAGVVALLNPVSSAYAVSVLVGMLLVTYGVAALSLWVNALRLEKSLGKLRSEAGRAFIDVTGTQSDKGDK